jgi:hypothetical protein
MRLAQLTACLHDLARHFKTEPTETVAPCFVHGHIAGRVSSSCSLFRVACKQRDATRGQLIFTITCLRNGVVTQQPSEHYYHATFPLPRDRFDPSSSFLAFCDC